MSMVDWVVFDLGGVIVDFDPDAVVRAYTRQAPERADIVAAALRDPDGLMARWGTGELSAHEYFYRMQQLTGVPMSRSEHERIDLSTLLGERSEMVDLLRALRYRCSVRLACLSNTHDLHWDHMLERYSCMRLFEVRLASHQIGVRKPDAAAFDALKKALGTDPYFCAYVDDSPGNVSAAERAGFRSFHFINRSSLVSQLRQIIDGRIE